MEKKENHFTVPGILLVIFLSFFCFAFIGGLLAVVFQHSDLLDSKSMQDLKTYLYLNIPFLLFLAAILLFSRLILKAGLKDLFYAGKAGRMKTALEVFLFYLLLLSLLSLTDFRFIKINPMPIQLRLLSIAVILPMTVIQTLTEELFFRSLLFRLFQRSGESCSCRKSLLISILSGFFFLLAHLANQESYEADYGFLILLSYFLWGFCSMLFSLYIGTFLISFAMHAANNLFIAMILNYTGTSLLSPSLFLDTKVLNGIETLIQLVIAFSGIFFLLKRAKEKL